ncbi:MAG: hypothetical protein PUA81_07305 [Oscillospiraceae bacterium]|nr:hypothetical protein [Oscillospiraceae bacterium]
MADSKLSLEDILNEYSPEKDAPEKTNESRLETEKLLNSAEKLSTPAVYEEVAANSINAQTTLRKHGNSGLSDGTLRRPNPANDVKPSDLSRSKVSFVNSEAMSEIRAASQAQQTAGYDSAEVRNTFGADHTPKIRRMTDSTRAKEIESIKKSRKRRRDSLSFTYKKERPDGEYMYSPPKVKRKNRSRDQIIDEANSPEGKKHITDIVPSPAAVEASKPIEPAPRAEKTSINLSESYDFDASELDVHITQDTDEYVSSRAKKKRTKRIVDFNYYGDVEDVGRDIYELKSSITARVVILTMMTVLSLYITITNQFDIPVISLLSKSNTKTYLLLHLLIGVVSAAASTSVITNGLKKLFTFRADSDSMTAVTIVSCIAAIIPALLVPELVLQNYIHIYMPVGVTALLINALGKLLIIKRAARNFNFVSKNFDRHGISYVRDEERAELLTRGTLGDFPILASMRKTDFLTDFLRYTYSSDMTDKFCRKASPLCLIFSALIAVFVTFARQGTLVGTESAAFGFSIYTMLLCAASCIAIPLVSNLPLENVSHKTIRNKGIMLGYQSVDDFYDTNSILINADKLFPANSVKLSGIKVFSNTKIDEALLEAASLTYHADSIMQQLFSDVIAGKEELLYNIENFSYEESLGLCGWINNKRVLFGSRELMTSHNIEGIPTKTKEDEYAANSQEALYLSISGNLAAMFIVDMTADKDVKTWFRRLCKNKICVIIKSVDPCVSLRKLSSLFGVPEEMLRIVPKKLHSDFDAETSKVVRLSSSMACTGKFSSLAQLIIGTKVVHSATIMGLIFQTVSILLGFGLCMLLILSKSFDYIYTSATALIIYNLICTALTAFAVSLKKL